MQKYFEILGVDKNATQEEIEKAYLAKKALSSAKHIIYSIFSIK